jgi:hypothetical protein
LLSLGMPSLGNIYCQSDACNGSPGSSLSILLGYYCRLTRLLSWLEILVFFWQTLLTSLWSEGQLAHRRASQ